MEPSIRRAAGNSYSSRFDPQASLRVVNRPDIKRARNIVEKVEKIAENFLNDFLTRTVLLGCWLVYHWLCRRIDLRIHLRCPIFSIGNLLQLEYIGTDFSLSFW